MNMGIEMTYLCDDKPAANPHMKNRINRIRLLSVLIVLLLISIKPICAQAPVTVSNQIETYEGKRYFLHTVEPRQTLFGISRAYNTTVDDLIRVNPEARSGLRVNQVLRVPVSEQSPQPQQSQQTASSTPEEETEPAIADRFEYIYHVTGKNETFRYIANIYMVPVNRINAANPGMREPIPEGEYVVVPIAPKTELAPVSTQARESSYDPFRTPPVRTVGEQRREQSLPVSRSATAQQGQGREPVQPPSQQRTEPNRSLTERREVSREMMEETGTGVQTISPFSIPGSGNDPSQQSASATTAPAPSGQQHVVKPRETLFSIAQQYGLSVDGLMALNPGISQMLSVGQVLVVSDQPGDAPTEVQQTRNEEEFITHVVKKGETLYRIARNYAVGIPELKQHNPGLTEQLAIGQEILIPKKKITQAFINHEVESGIWSRRLANKFEISRERFRYFNPDIGWRVRPGDQIRIPIADHLSIGPVLPVLPDTTVQIELPGISEEEPEQLIICPDQAAHSDALFRVALMVPFFLDEVEDFQSFDLNEDLSHLRDARPFSFLQFYEGFLVAADSLVNSRGLKLELFVYDVSQNPDQAMQVLTEPALLHADLIIGPFFSRSFDVVAQFAREHNIPIVNPMAQRSQIVEGYPNVIKVKPNIDCQYEQVAQMIADNYPDARVFIYRAHGFTDFEASRKLKEALERHIRPEVPVANQWIYNLADRRTRGFEDMMDMIPAITVEGRTFYTDMLREELYETTVFDNSITEFVYASDSIREFAKMASALRDNVVITITDDNVFAMEFINKLNQVADTFSVKLIGLPNWKQFDNLFIESLLKMQTHHLVPGHIDYTAYQTEQFIDAFRNRFASEPGEYAFEGFDIGWFFLQALMHYGNNMLGCLPYFSPELSQTRFHFKRNDRNNGLENCFWNFYRYQNYQRVPIWNTYFIKNPDY